MLLGRKNLARTSQTPGATRQINFFDVALVKGPKLTFVDLPGYGYAKVSRAESRSWKDLLEGYLQSRATLRAVVLLVDLRRGFEQEERDLVEFLGLVPGLTVVVAATKADKLARSAQKPAVQRLAKESGLRTIATSAETKLGREELWSRILEKVV
jgi:GTP-binding protein